ncbi:hypothetical protein ACJX0J_006598, partial [Zea mays]
MNFGENTLLFKIAVAYIGYKKMGKFSCSIALLGDGVLGRHISRARIFKWKCGQAEFVSCTANLRLIIHYQWMEFSPFKFNRNL